MKRFLAWGLPIGLALAGCAPQPTTRLNAPPHGTSDNLSEMQGTLTYMTDNALLADMCVSDVHFVPHRALLNSLGEERVRRLAQLVETYGGTIRLSTNVTDEKLVKARLDTVVALLNEAGLDTSQHMVVSDLPGGDGMDASQAILIKANEGTYKPPKNSNAATDPLGAAGGSSPR